MVEVGGGRTVVYGHAAVLLDADVGELGDALEGAVLGGLEVEGGGPVVAEVLRGAVSEASRGAVGGLLRSRCRKCTSTSRGGRIWRAPSVYG